MELRVIKAERHHGTMPALWIGHGGFHEGKPLMKFVRTRSQALTMTETTAQQRAEMLAKQNPGWAFTTESL